MVISMVVDKSSGAAIEEVVADFADRTGGSPLREAGGAGP